MAAVKTVCCHSLCCTPLNKTICPSFFGSFLSLHHYRKGRKGKGEKGEKGEKGRGKGRKGGKRRKEGER